MIELSPDLLVHASNLILLLAYTTHNMLWLRVLALAAAVSIIPYYVIQPAVLWPPILWSGVYALVHSYHICALLLERRAVRLSPEEQRLRKRSFPSLEPVLFLRLLRLATWQEAPAGTEFPPARDAVTLLSAGRVHVTAAGVELGYLDPGDLVGVAVMLDQQAGWLRLVAVTPVRFVRWDRSTLEDAMEASPPIRAACTALLNHDLASKLMRLASERIETQRAHSA